MFSIMFRGKIHGTNATAAVAKKEEWERPGVLT